MERVAYKTLLQMKCHRQIRFGAVCKLDSCSKGFLSLLYFSYLRPYKMLGRIHFFPNITKAFSSFSLLASFLESTHPQQMIKTIAVTGARGAQGGSVFRNSSRAVTGKFVPSPVTSRAKRPKLLLRRVQRSLLPISAMSLSLVRAFVVSPSTYISIITQTSKPTRPLKIKLGVQAIFGITLLGATPTTRSG